MVEHLSHEAKILKKSAQLLWHSIKKEDNHKVSQVLSSGFPIDDPITDGDLSAFSFACSQITNQDTLILIAKFGPNVNSRDKSQRTPLH